MFQMFHYSFIIFNTKKKKKKKKTINLKLNKYFFLKKKFLQIKIIQKSNISCLFCFKESS